MGFYDMHIYDVKMALRDTFYGEPSVLFGTPHQDANALVALSCGIFRLRAMNGRHYWYFFMKDIRNRDLVRFCYVVMDCVLNFICPSTMIMTISNLRFVYR